MENKADGTRQQWPGLDKLRDEIYDAMLTREQLGGILERRFGPLLEKAQALFDVTQMRHGDCKSHAGCPYADFNEELSKWQ